MQVIKTNETFDSLDKSKLERMLDIKEAHREGHLTLEEAKERMKKKWVPSRRRVCRSRATLQRT